MSFAEVKQLLGWAAAEGWNPGLSDAQAFYAVDPDGFIGAFVDGAMVAAISAVAYDEAFGFIGLYICHSDFRGQGHGKAVWDAGLAHLGDRTIGLDAVPAQRQSYERRGFAAAYETIRMTGAISTSPVGKGEAVALDPDDAALVADIDGQGFAATRDRFLGSWLTPPNRALAIMAGRAARSYGVLRPCADGHKVGPLFAAHLSDARTLFQALTAGVSGAVQVDVPAEQTVFLDYLSNLGFRPGFLTTRMYRGPAPKLVQGTVFGITSLELG